jgi:hypothetical protein
VILAPTAVSTCKTVEPKANGYQIRICETDAGDALISTGTTAPPMSICMQKLNHIIAQVCNACKGIAMTWII